MHVHLPKPLHGWREFAGEVGIIVLGVLIALGAQQVAEDWQWRSDVRAADRRVVEELKYDVALAYDRLAIDPCLRPRLAELRDQLLKNEPTWPGSRANLANDLFKSDFPAVYRTPGRPWKQASWAMAQSGGVLEHFQPDRALQLAGLFDTVAILKQYQSEEENAAETLGDLAFPGPITPAERRANLKVVARLNALDVRILFTTQILIDGAHAAGIRADRSTIKDLSDQQRTYRGTCVRDLGKVS